MIYRFRGRKVILFDSDMIFLREPKFIIDWAEDGEGYCFYSDGGSLLADTFHRIGFDFPKVDVMDFNSGIVGFHNRVDDDILREIIDRIKKFDKNLFLNWEIEQAIWSVVFNQFENPVNLDRVQTDYVGSGWWSYSRLKRQCVVAHFVGAIRFKNFRYVRLANIVLRKLQNSNDRKIYEKTSFAL